MALVVESAISGSRDSKRRGVEGFGIELELLITVPIASTPGSLI
jgi:hypothetical protein